MAKIYYWTYRSHPHSPNEEFLYDGIIIVPQTIPNSNADHYAHKRSKDIISDISETDQSVNYDLGVHIITPIDNLIRKEFDINVNTEMETDINIDEEKMTRVARDEITEQDVLEVAERQTKIERHQMGENVDGILDFDVE